MPFYACRVLWEYPSCGVLARPQAGDCCLFCLAFVLANLRLHPALVGISWGPPPAGGTLPCQLGRCWLLSATRR